MEIIDTILSSAYFDDQPPVLIDIGASGEINKKWKRIAPYSVCICFDADDRDFNIDENRSSPYKKLVTVNRIVTDTDHTTASFYLTNSPYCSSTLEPEQSKLDPWMFRSLFDVVSKVELKTISIDQALTQAGINYIDWFKTDSQGTDLRLYTGLPADLKKNILAAEFEPGIIDAYKGEDKLFPLMKQLKDDGFWLSGMNVLGTQRIQEKYVNDFGSHRIQRLVPESPCWSELTYFREVNFSDMRQLFLLYVFAVLQRQYGFALEVSEVMLQQSGEEMAVNCKKTVYDYLKHSPVLVHRPGRIRNFLSRILSPKK